MIETFDLPVPLGRSSEPRKTYVYIPDYAEEGDRFPVLYMFDGHNVFFDSDATYGKSWGMNEYLTQTRMPLIVVAVDCNHHRNNGRLREYSPYSMHDSRFGNIRGQGNKFMQWFSGPCKEVIDARYPTLPDREHTFIAGSSMGGLMAIYAMIAFPDIYSRAAALSPSVWVNLPAMLSDIGRLGNMDGTVLYMDYGSNELANHEDMLDGLERVNHALLQHSICTTLRIVPGGEHCEACWEEQLPFFMPLFFYAHQ